MNNLMKSFLSNPSEEKWKAWREYQPFFAGRESGFDELFDWIKEFHAEFSKFPTPETLELGLQASNDFETLKYLQSIQKDPGLKLFATDVEFYGYLTALEQMIYEMDLIKEVKSFNNNLAGMQGKSVEKISEELKELISKLHKSHGRIVKEDKSVSGLIYGPEAVKEFNDLYSDIKAKKAAGQSLYYDFGIDKFGDVKMKEGDLVIIGGHTSQGKSVWARYLAYRFLVEYGLNVLYISMEMKYSNQLALFQILHANNKDIFPGTPKISFTKFKEGNLTQDEENFLMKVAAPDLANSQNYSSLYIEQPNKSKYRLLDVREKLQELENTLMNIQVLVIDYATMLYPIESDRKQPDREDYNLMIKEIKNLAMTHKDRMGNLTPLICITPAQISRDHFEEAVKNKGKYDITCLRQYSELEMSADIVVTTLLTEENRLNGQIRLQNVKNRDGAVVIDPVDCNIDLDHGFRPHTVKKQTPQETIQALHKTLNL